MDVSSDDRLAAAVFALGLSLGFFRREDVVRWADRRIESLDAAPIWLIDLSLSHNLLDAHLISLLRRVGAGADPLAQTEAMYALFPPVEARTFEEAEKVAARLYRITYECLGGDWKVPLLAEADEVADTFDFVRDGYVNLSREDAVDRLHRFVERHRNAALVALLAPVRWAEGR